MSEGEEMTSWSYLRNRFYTPAIDVTDCKKPISWEEIPIPEVFAGGELTKVYREEFIKSLGMDLVEDSDATDSK